MPKETDAVFHNGSNYDCHFTIKELANEIAWGTSWMSWKKYGKVQTFSVQIEKDVTKVHEDDNEDITTSSYKIKFIDSKFIMKSCW